MEQHVSITCGELAEEGASHVGAWHRGNKAGKSGGQRERGQGRSKIPLAKYVEGKPWGEAYGDKEVEDGG